MSMQAAIAFAGAAPRYWGSAHPLARAQVRALRRRAQTIPDPRLRGIALEALTRKRANLDGAAAFAAFVPARSRAASIRAVVAFQALYDYLDVLTERPKVDPVGDSRRLHGALTAALEADGGAAPDCDDGGYLQGTVERCRGALRELPGYPAVAGPAMRLTGHIVAFQSHNAANTAATRADLARWAGEHTPPGSDLRWWETAASAGSSLGVFALIAMAAQPRPPAAADALAVENAYFPWIGALHSLLDSLIDREEDRAAGQHALIDHYGDPAEAAARLRLLAAESRARAAALPGAGVHLALLASMASLYLSEREADAAHAAEPRRAVLTALGALTGPAGVAMRARRLTRSREKP